MKMTLSGNFKLTPIFCLTMLFSQLATGCRQKSEPVETQFVTITKIWNLETGKAIGNSVTISTDTAERMIIELLPAEQLPEMYLGEPVSDPLSWPIGFVFYPSDSEPDSKTAARLGAIPVFYPQGIHVPTLGRFGPPGVKTTQPKVEATFDEGVIPHWTYLFPAIKEPGDYKLEIFTFPSYRQTTGTTWVPGKKMILKILDIEVK